jgi:hypothetical protein
VCVAVGREPLPSEAVQFIGSARKPTVRRLLSQGDVINESLSNEPSPFSEFR